MSEPSDFESIVSDVIISPCSSIDDIDVTPTNHSVSTENTKINKNNVETYDPTQYDVYLTDSDHSLLEVPKQLNVSSPSSICSTKPLEWDSGADVGYDILSKQQSQDMSTIERIAVNSIVCNANSTPTNYGQVISLKSKSNSLINLNGIKLHREKKSASLETVNKKNIACKHKSDTLPKCRSPMASSQSVSTVVHKLESLNLECNKQLNFEQHEKRLEKSILNSNVEIKSPESSKESNSTLGSADTVGSWEAKEFRDSTNATTDRVNSFEYLPGNTYYNGRGNEPEDSDEEIKQSTKMFVEAMKQNGLTNEYQRKEIFQEIVESFLQNYALKKKNSSIKSSSDTDQTPVKQDFTSQTTNTGNTIVNNKTNNQSSTITFTSPITSSRYGDDVDSKYGDSSMDSGRHIDLQKCKLLQSCTPTNTRKNQGVQCTIRDSLKNIHAKENLKQSTSSKLKTSKTIEKNSEFLAKSGTRNNGDVNEELKNQMIWFHKNYMKTERENQMLWINSQITHLNNLKKLLNTHEELKKNWNSYKQKQTTNNKSKFRQISRPISNSSSDYTTTTTTKTDSTISSKQFSLISRCNDTDGDSSTTLCDHVHYKKGILIDEPKSMKRCCEKTLNVIEMKTNQNSNKLKTVWSQTDSVNETKSKTHRKSSSQIDPTNTIDHNLKPISCRSSISYEIIFKPNSAYSKKKDFVSNKSKQKHSISVACQTNEIPFQPKSSLQEYLMINRPDYVCRAEERRNIVADLASLRDKRQKLKKKVLITNNFENKVPPNPLAVKRVMSQREMRKQTERKYRRCPEVKNKKVEINRKEEYKINKIMANIFNKRLQKKTLKGKVDLSNSISVCSL